LSGVLCVWDLPRPRCTPVLCLEADLDLSLLMVLLFRAFTSCWALLINTSVLSYGLGLLGPLLQERERLRLLRPFAVVLLETPESTLTESSVSVLLSVTVGGFRMEVVCLALPPLFPPFLLRSRPPLAGSLAPPIGFTGLPASGVLPPSFTACTLLLGAGDLTPAPPCTLLLGRVRVPV
jgi:hypothetical protein